MIDLLSLGRVSSEYGHRKSPGGIGSTDHKGIDIVLSNKKIPAVVGGKVVENTYNSARGYYITIESDNGYRQRYQHMNSKSKLAVGSTVKEGDTIGIMGSTGNSTGAHLHFEVMNKAGEYINPRNWLKGADGDPTYDESEGSETGSETGSENSVGLVWWGDIVKVVVSALLVIGGVTLLVIGVKDTVLKK